MNFIKKSVLSVCVCSSLFAGGAFAATASNDSSEATLNFAGRVTSSSCQVATDNVTKNIDLGEATKLQLMNNATAAQTFYVTLTNCDSDTDTISYSLNDSNANTANKNYLALAAGDNSAEGVGVYVTKTETGESVQTGTKYDLETLDKDADGNTASTQTLAFNAQVRKLDSVTEASHITAGTVSAAATLVIKAAVEAAEI